MDLGKAISMDAVFMPRSFRSWRVGENPADRKAQAIKFPLWKQAESPVTGDSKPLVRGN
jgi:hypothetical protein